MLLKTAKGNWNLHGINVISSDSIYQKVVEAINSGNLSEQHLQKITGSAYPVTVDIQGRSIYMS